MQKRLVQLERAQQHRYPPHANGDCDRNKFLGTIIKIRLPVHLNPNNNNVVDHETFPWCITCQDAHDEDSCLSTIQVRESNNEVPIEFDNMNYVGGKSDTICSVTGRDYTIFEDQMNQIYFAEFIFLVCQHTKGYPLEAKELNIY